MIRREKSFKFPVFTWNYGVQGVIMGLTLFYGYGAVFDTNNMVCLERLAWHLNFVSKNVNQYHYWLNNIFHVKENNLWSAVNKNWKTWKISFFFSKVREILFMIVKTYLTYYKQIIFLVRPTWRSLNYRTKAGETALIYYN